MWVSVHFQVNVSAVRLQWECKWTIERTKERKSALTYSNGIFCFSAFFSFCFSSSVLISSNAASLCVTLSKMFGLFSKVLCEREPKQLKVSHFWLTWCQYTAALESPVTLNMHFFGLWAEYRVSGENPSRLRENLQTPNGKAIRPYQDMDQQSSHH